jgi:hypothetical protein
MKQAGFTQKVIMAIVISAGSLSAEAYEELSDGSLDNAVGASVRVADNLVAFYPFVTRTGNVVRDLSGSASPMDLTTGT